MTRPSLEEQLRADAARMRQAPSPELHERIMANLESPPLSAGASRRSWRPALVAAAAIVLVASALFLVVPSRLDSPIEASTADVVELSRDILNPPLLASVTTFEDPLMAEARSLWADTTRAAESVARGLRTPLRLRAHND
jgi:hypothetical protein